MEKHIGRRICCLFEGLGMFEILVDLKYRFMDQLDIARNKHSEPDRARDLKVPIFRGHRDPVSPRKCRKTGRRIFSEGSMLPGPKKPGIAPPGLLLTRDIDGANIIRCYVNL